MVVGSLCHDVVVVLAREFGDHVNVHSLSLVYKDLVELILELCSDIFQRLAVIEVLESSHHDVQVGDLVEGDGEACLEQVVDS